MDLINASDNCEFSKNVITFGVDNSSSMRADNRYSLIFGKDRTDRLDTTTAAEAEYSVTISEQQQKSA